MQIHHIGYLVKNIYKSVEAFKLLGFDMVSSIVEDSIRLANICFLENEGYCIELVAPNKDSDLYGLLKKYKNTAYHICYKVDSIKDVAIDMEKKGYHVFKEREQAPAIGEHAYVTFLMGADLGMVELLEEV